MAFNIAVAIPCHNEAMTIAKVVRDFRAVLPEASICVFDNNSTDGSANLAKGAGANVYYVHKRGKGNVMRAIFDTIIADVIIVVDGDDTYFAEEAPTLLKPILNGEADMVVGNRLQYKTNKSFTKLHLIGNYLITRTINWTFGIAYYDILSGYRALSRHFVESIPLLTPGFETEVELTLQALVEDLDIKETPISYRSRPTGSRSKLRVFHDGFRVILAAAVILRDYNPLRTYGLIGVVCMSIALMAGLLKLMNYPWFTSLPNTLSVGITLIFASVGIIAFGIGLTLSAINTRFREIKQIINRGRKYVRPR